MHVLYTRLNSGTCYIQHIKHSICNTQTYYNNIDFIVQSTVAHTEQQATKVPKMACVKQFK